MKSLTFIFVSLLSGVIAGVILAGVNYFVAEPFIDQAIGIEVDNSIASGEVVDFDELSSLQSVAKGRNLCCRSILRVNIWCDFRNCLCNIEKVFAFIGR